VSFLTGQFPETIDSLRSGKRAEKLISLTGQFLALTVSLAEHPETIDSSRSRAVIITEVLRRTEANSGDAHAPFQKMDAYAIPKNDETCSRWRKATGRNNGCSANRRR
jgi:hypothetical protein